MVMTAHLITTHKLTCVYHCLVSLVFFWIKTKNFTSTTTTTTTANNNDNKLLIHLLPFLQDLKALITMVWLKNT